MTRSDLSLQLTRREAVAAGDPIPRFVTIEQLPIPENQETVNVRDLYRMFDRALTGLSAQAYRTKGCPVEFFTIEREEDGETIEVKMARIWLSFWVLPSSHELEYELTADIGELDDGEVVSLPRDRNIVFEMSDHVDLDFAPESLSMEWRSGCWINDLDTIPAPVPTFDGPRIIVPQEMFAVARIVANAYAIQHRLTIELEKGDNKITGLEPVITAAWQDEEGKYQTEQLTLKLPACVEKALELCEGNFGDTICVDGAEDPPVTVYIGKCNGAVLDVRQDDPEDPCA